MIFNEEGRRREMQEWEEFRKDPLGYYRKRAPRIHPARQHVMDIVEEAGGEPIRITTVANVFARHTGHHWKSRAEREELKKQALRIVGELIKGYYLERHRRNWVRWWPPDNTKRKASDERVDQMLKSLPKPNV